MLDCKICGSEASFIKQVEGYREGRFYNIHYCEYCDASFSDSHIEDYTIYNLIYDNSSSINGYNRYDTYKDKVLKDEKPFEYLSEAEDMYWAIKQSIKKDYIRKTDKILEVGCGMGYLTYSMLKEGFNIRGCDISQRAIEKARQTYNLENEDLFFEADVYELSENNNSKFDVIILTEVIEHIFNPSDFIKTLFKLLNSGGHIIITTPNKSAYNKSIFWTSDLPPVHYWWLSEQSFINIAKFTNSGIYFIDFTDYNSKNNIFVNDSNIKDGKPTFDRNGIIIKNNNSITTSLKKLVKQTPIYTLYMYLNFVYTKKDIKKSFVLCCILEKK